MKEKIEDTNTPLQESKEAENKKIIITIPKEYEKIESGTRTPEEQVKFCLEKFEVGHSTPNDLSTILGGIIAKYGDKIKELIPDKATSKTFGEYELELEK